MYELTHGLAYLVFKYQLLFFDQLTSVSETTDYTEAFSFVKPPSEVFNFSSFSVEVSFGANMYSLHLSRVCQGDPRRISYFCYFPHESPENRCFTCRDRPDYIYQRPTWLLPFVENKVPLNYSSKRTGYRPSNFCSLFQASQLR
jgi:hypothetical protein